MRSSADQCNKNHTVYSRVFGALVVLWAGLGLQPCAMAAVNDAGCPHCPPEHAQPMATHGGDSHGDHGDGKTGLSCCTGMQSMDCDADEAAVDSRIGKVGVDDAGVFVAAVSAVSAIVPVASDTFVAIASNPPERRRSIVPLRILYCVYRD